MSNPGQLQHLLRTAEPATLGPERRPGTWSESEVRREIAEVAPDAAKAITALVLLWHDHLDASHTISQSIDGPNGAFVHGIMHRREPDYGNAAYWFRRVGKHPAFTEITERVQTILAGSQWQELRNRLLPGGTWNPFGFIEACEDAQGGDERTTETLRHIQQVEFECLLDWLTRHDPAA